MSLFDQFLAWFGSFLPGQKPQVKTIISLPTSPTSTNGVKPMNSDASNTIDPNG